MAGNAKDYYDIPAEWIPSSNFANRPASEISEITLIDGVGTFVYLSGSSSSSSTETVSVSAPKPQKPSESPTIGSIPALGPTITVFAPSEEDVSKPRARSLSDDPRMLGRPVMHKAASAPPGTLSMPEYKPQLPRRAISARPRRPKRARENEPQQLRLLTGHFALKKAGNNNNEGPKKQLPVPLQPAKDTNGKHASKDAKLPGSFSQKTRVRKTLDDKNLGLLKTDIIDDESGNLSPMSIIATPRELYAIPEKQIASAELCSPSSPHAKDARRSIMSSLSGTTPTLCLSKTRLSQTKHNDHINAIYLKGWRQVYLPGSIRLEPHPAKLRKDSVASLDPFDKEVEPRGRRQSEMVTIDSITAFFDGFAALDEATGWCLDRYWLDTSRAPSPITPDRKFSVTSVEETRLRSPEKPRRASILQASRFSFSSASSSSSLPRSGTPKRQRDKLKRLLSPAFPGSGWMRNPVEWGQQAES
ncbi:hypothetical protein DE146DRAFT_369991 [Phaeosphaeria sp. MPI-PUGE-AT-0046c]|nr:hypothetical protein DE146DRAFT_369991 [Phaeosphaeria sp. MPI-PUGE-AT-0046c]